MAFLRNQHCSSLFSGPIGESSPVSSLDLEAIVVKPNRTPTVLVVVTRCGMQPLETHLPLWRALCNDDYKALNFTTEALGAAFGFCVPQGTFYGILGIEADNLARQFLDEVIADKNGFELAIGSSSFVPIQEKGVFHIGIPFVALASALRPQVAIIQCCLHDGVKYLRNLVEYLHLSVGVNAIGISVADNLIGINVPEQSSLLRRVSDARLRTHAEELSKSTGLPAFLLSDGKAGEALKQTVIDYFAA